MKESCYGRELEITNVTMQNCLQSITRHKLYHQTTPQNKKRETSTPGIDKKDDQKRTKTERKVQNFYETYSAGAWLSTY